MSRATRVVLGVMVCGAAVGWPVAVAAQPVRPLAASFRAGIVPSEAGTSAAVGGTIAVALTERVAVEADATYVTQARWSSTFTLGGSALVALGGGWSDPVVPFVGGGLAWHRATVTLADPRLLGPIPEGIASGARFCAGPGGTSRHGPGAGVATCAGAASLGVWDVGDLPVFYARRLGVLEVPAGRRWPDRTFDDPAVTLNLGVRLSSDSGWFVQPEARIWVVLADGRSRTSGVFSAAAGYRF